MAKDNSGFRSRSISVPSHGLTETWPETVLAIHHLHVLTRAKLSGFI